MQSSSIDIVLVLGAFAGMLVAFYKMIGTKDDQSSHDREADREERIALTTAINKLAENSGKQVEEARLTRQAQQQGFREAKERNGHLGDQNVKITELIVNQNTDTKGIRESNHKIADILSKSALIAAEDRDALLTPAEQHIKTQIVEHQEVKTKE